jgi:hypothetical protein
MNDSPRTARLVGSNSCKDMVNDNFVLKEKDYESRIQFEQADDDPIHASEAPSEINLLDIPSNNTSSIDIFSTECNDCDERHSLRQVCTNTLKTSMIATFDFSSLSPLHNEPC